MYRVRYLEHTDKLGERVCLSMLEEVSRREWLVECVQRSQRRARKARRVRQFTGLAVLWLVLAMVLWSRLAQGRVWDKLTHWLQESAAGEPSEPAGASAVASQRARLGVEPLQHLFEQGTHLLGQPQTPGVDDRGYRLMALDGTLCNLPDTAANEAAFGRSRNQYGKGAYPQARVVLLNECGTHATIGLPIGRSDQSEQQAALALLPKLERGMLLLHEANFFSGGSGEALRAQGVRTLGALASTVALERRRNLPDGSYLALLQPSKTGLLPRQGPLWVRIIEYQLTDERLGEPGRVYRLATTWLNPRTAPAGELMVLSHERWEGETVLDEVKTHRRVQQRVLRSHTPQGVRQELYALFVVHCAMRALMAQAALEAELDPDRLSVTEAMFQVCETLSDEGGEQAPEVQQQRAARLRQRLRRRLLPERFLRLHRRELKQVYRKYKPKKRDVPAPKPFEPEQRFADFVLLLLRPQGSKVLSEGTVMSLI